MTWCSLGSFFCITSKQAHINKRTTHLESKLNTMHLKNNEFDENSTLIKMLNNRHINKTSYFPVTKPPYGLGKRIIVARPGLVVVKSASNLDIHTIHKRHSNTVLFYIRCPVLTGTCKQSMHFSAHSSYHQSPLVRQLMKVEGVSGVTLAVDHIEVERDANNLEITWTILKPKLLAAIIDFFASDLPAYTEGRSSIPHDLTIPGLYPSTLCDELQWIIEDLINTRVRPFVQEDGGDVVFKKFDPNDGSVYVAYYGTCILSPKITAALAEIILTLLQYHLPEVSRVKQSNGIVVGKSRSLIS